MAIGTDRVQVSKFERSSEGGDDADSGVYGNPVEIDPQEDAIESAGIYLQDASNRDETIYLARTAGDIQFKTGTHDVTLSDLISGTDGHETLDTLTHDLAENSYLEVTRSVGQVTNITIWETSSKLKKVREYQVTRASGKVSTIVAIQYDGAGTETYRLTETVARTAGKVSSITSVRTDA